MIIFHMRLCGVGEGQKKSCQPDNFSFSHAYPCFFSPFTAFSHLFTVLLIVPPNPLSGVIHNEELRLRWMEEKKNENGSNRFVSKMSMNQLSDIERFTVYKGRVLG